MPPSASIQALNLVISFGVMALLFEMIFKLMPTVPVAWHDVWIGAAVTALLFKIGKFLIGLYLGKSDLGSAFAGAGSLVILLAWVYYTAQIFLLGAEFTKVYAHLHGSATGTGQVPESSAPRGVITKSSLGGDSSNRGKGPANAPGSCAREVHVAQRELDRRTSKAAAALLPRVVLLGTVSLLRLWTDQRLMRGRKQLRRAKRVVR